MLSSLLTDFFTLALNHVRLSTVSLLFASLAQNITKPSLPLSDQKVALALAFRISVVTVSLLKMAIDRPSKEKSFPMSSFSCANKDMFAAKASDNTKIFFIPNKFLSLFHEKCADYLYASPRFTTNLKRIIETSAHMARRSNCVCYRLVYLRGGDSVM